MMLRYSPDLNERQESLMAVKAFRRLLIVEIVRVGNPIRRLPIGQTVLDQAERIRID